MSDSAFVYAADLQAEFLGELLVKIHHHRVPGVIEAVNGDVTKRLFIRDGNVVYASSNDRTDRLGPYLLSQGRISPEQLETLAEARRRGHKRFGMLLMDEGLLAPGEIKAAIQQQVERIAWSLFSWSEGSARFEIQELRERNAIRIQVPILHMVLRGTRHRSDAQRALEALGGSQARLVAGYDAEEAIDIALDGEEYTLLRAIDGEQTVGDLCKSGSLPAEEAIQLLLAFKTLGLVHPRNLEDGGRRVLLKRSRRASGD